jgi:hypothetical protein
MYSSVGRRRRAGEAEGGIKKLEGKAIPQRGKWEGARCPRKRGEGGSGGRFPTSIS